MHESEKWKWSFSVVFDSLWPHGLQPIRLLRPWDFPVLEWGAITFSEAWFNAWQIIIHHCAFLLNKGKNCGLFTSSHGSPNLQAFGFSLKYVSSPDTRILLHASTRVKAFYLWEIWQHRVCLLEWLALLLSLLFGSHIETIFIPTIDGWWGCE